MQLLLDTHIWLWYLLKNPKLSTNLQNVIADPNNGLWLSPISIWETIILAEKNRISLQPNTTTWVNLALKNLGTYEATLNNDIALLSRQIELPHQDPADRFIVASAVFYNLKLATVDVHLTSCSWLQTIS
ncbi:hypothetical protein Syn7502_02073 [Synechococcus sp. PCC 7502]|uniref:type II toxin-antitoxin system VapC family toxin n=1 Tax=Synechococcus sp. PCC 7502 TaxID=1173263 RepID=UPI00029F86D9|nr:PIN domain-containing protein [Synechococcus sp. PCC 7502]AFY74094.1 hypothetical protein Syn7502_02073 [Synechococcus sp. PCC 7502]